VRCEDAWGGVLLLTVVCTATAWGVDVFPCPAARADPYGLLTYGWVAGLSLLGASASYLQRLADRPNAFSCRRAAAEASTAMSAGLCAFWGGESAGADLRLTAVAVVVAGYWGKQALERLKPKDSDHG
jgi:hypothetical protein